MEGRPGKWLGQYSALAIAGSIKTQREKLKNLGGHMEEELIKIEKGIEIPPLGRPAIYPLRKMEVGDSFEVETTNRARRGLYCLAHNAGIKITTRSKRTEGDPPKFKTRVWRIA